MVETKTLLKGAGIVILAYVLIQIAFVVFDIVLGAITFALTLLFFALLAYGLYWAYKTFIADSNSTTREREKIYER